MTHHFRFGAISPEPLDFSALQMKADSDPVGLLCRCRKRYKAIAQGTRQLHWELLVACYAGALGIRKRPELFKDLLEHDFFKQRTYAAKINDVLRLALIIGTDAEGTGPTYKNACYVAARLQPLFDQDHEPEGVLGMIEAAGGLKRLHGEDEAPEEAKRGASENAGGSGDAENTNSAVDGASSTSEEQLKDRHQPLTPPDDDKKIILHVVVTKKMLLKVLNSPFGSRASLIVEHVASDTAWQRVEAHSTKLIH